MGRCIICGRSEATISDVLGVCVYCLRSRPHEALRIAMRAHVEYRRRLGLPLEPRGMLVGLGAVFALMSA
jgi:pyruvate formate lyase activating enzyme